MTSLVQRRHRLATAIEHQLGPFDPLQLDALREVPRERFVRADDIDKSADDTPLPLDDEGLATISAPHAYLLSYRLVALAPGDALVELGSGTGYGAALASFIVGPRGHVLTIEIDATLWALARGHLAALANVTVVAGDAIDTTRLWGHASKVVCTFAVDDLPPAWLDAIPDGGVLVAPVGADPTHQQLVRVAREGKTTHVTRHGGVRYVKNRSLVGARVGST